MTHAAAGQERVEAVLARLDRVVDPELDEPVTRLGFVTGVAVDAAGAVAIDFRLPTYWCAANFAFLMADDMRREVAALPWVTGVVPRLGLHMYADQINDGVARGLSFAETFGEAAAGDLDTLRRTFLVKAFQRRLEALLRHLLAAGHADLAALSCAALEALALSDEGRLLRQRYLDRRGICARPGETLAFVDAAGEALGPLDAALRVLARVGVNAEFNGAICRGLLAARFPNAAPGLGADPLGADPTLQDFVAAAARNLGRAA